MSVKTRDELIASLSELLKDNTSDEAISIIEDVSDTFESFNDTENWKEKYEANDKEWRQKYKERFENKNVEVPEPPEPENGILTYEDLFEVKE